MPSATATTKHLLLRTPAGFRGSMHAGLPWASFTSCRKDVDCKETGRMCWAALRGVYLMQV